VTPTGAARAQALFGSTVIHRYVPYDLPGAVRRFFDRVRPQLAVILETGVCDMDIERVADAMASAAANTRARFSSGRLRKASRQPIRSRCCPRPRRCSRLPGRRWTGCAAN
jgi:3-deoxy-D-manno-octulosonic-acid transferase